MAVDLTNYIQNQTPATGMVDKGQSGDVLASGQANIASSYTTFMSLLTAQLKNQDPLSPMDTNNFTQQLVQMTGVQQQLLSNQLLKQLVTAAANGGVGDAISLIGKTVTAPGDQAKLSDGKAVWNYELGKDAASATLTVTDENGKVMWTGAAPELGKGEHAFTWDGKGTYDGTEGKTYTLKIEARDASGLNVATATYIRGVANSVRQDAAAGTLVEVAGLEIPLTSVNAVRN